MPSTRYQNWEQHRWPATPTETCISERPGSLGGRRGFRAAQRSLRKIWRDATRSQTGNGAPELGMPWGRLPPCELAAGEPNWLQLGAQQNDHDLRQWIVSGQPITIRRRELTRYKKANECGSR